MVDVYLSTRWDGETNERHANRVVGAAVLLLCLSLVPMMLLVPFLLYSLCHCFI